MGQWNYMAWVRGRLLIMSMLLTGREVRGLRYQRGSLSGMSVKRIAGASAADVVTITAGTFIAFAFGADATARHHFRSDGTFDTQQNNQTAVQINASTDWIIPNSSAPGAYRVRHTAESGDTGGPWTPAASINTYVALSTNRIYKVVDTTTTLTTRSVDYTAEIDDGSVSQDSSAMTLTADREDF